MTRRKVNVTQVCASIRLDLIEKLGLEVPNGTVRIGWRDGDRKVWILVDGNVRLVFSSLDDRVMLEGKI